MSTRLIIEGNSVYEIDEECLACSRDQGERRREAADSLLLYGGEEKKKKREGSV